MDLKIASLCLFTPRHFITFCSTSPSLSVRRNTRVLVQHIRTVHSFTYPLPNPCYCSHGYQSKHIVHARVIKPIITFPFTLPSVYKHLCLVGGPFCRSPRAHWGTLRHIGLRQAEGQWGSKNKVVMLSHFQFSQGEKTSTGHTFQGSVHLFAQIKRLSGITSLGKASYSFRFGSSAVHGHLTCMHSCPGIKQITSQWGHTYFYTLHKRK